MAHEPGCLEVDAESTVELVRAYALHDILTLDSEDLIAKTIAAREGGLCAAIYDVLLRIRRAKEIVDGLPRI